MSIVGGYFGLENVLDNMNFLKSHYLVRLG